ncbi:limbic system-associated membrane protein isoform X2 [Chironomus tepperi]|uniref:limbic system-associated membrane protein isoform X2 n=1 Tax=Chironomus tepperi TaxID=113505 RepID=UPI00391FA3F1
MDKKLLMSIGLLFIVLITQYANCAPAETDNDESEYLQDGEEIYDDNYDEKDDDKDKKIASTTETNEIYKTDNYTETIDAGKNVRLECKGEFDESAIFLWYNGTRIISQGQAFQITDKRIRLSKKDGSLTIEGVNSYDNAMYKCRAFQKGERFETNVQLIVNGPPKTIMIGHNRDNTFVSGKELIYKAGEKDLRFKCTVPNTHPEAKITWIHNGNAIQESKDRDIKFVEESILEIRVLHARHSGEYECEATNEYGSAKAKFSIDVQFAPFFRPHHNFFNADIGNDVEIFCTYKASPAATSVKWYKNGNQIHENDKYVVKADEKDHHDRTKLLIKDVEQNDLGVYYCEIQNSLGTKKENITLDLVPAPPKFEAFKYINNYLYTDWIVKSHQELQSMIILYRNNENGWSQAEAKITNQNPLKAGEFKVQGSLSLEAGEWTIMGRAKNSYGWSDDAFAQQTTIKVPKETTESAEMTSSASSIVSSICGSLVAILITRYFV